MFGLNQLAPKAPDKILINRRTGRKFAPIFLRGWVRGWGGTREVGRWCGTRPPPPQWCGVNKGPVWGWGGMEGCTNGGMQGLAD